VHQHTWVGCLLLQLCFRALAPARPRQAAPARRLEAIRTSRLAIDPAEERALLSEAQLVAAGRTAPAAGSGPAGRGRGRGRARGGRGDGRGRAERPPAVTGRDTTSCRTCVCACGCVFAAAMSSCALHSPPMLVCHDDMLHAGLLLVLPT